MNTETKNCLECHSSIEVEARKCTACGAYQDWTRFIFRYTSIITALLGIIPVITIAASLYELAFGEKTADVRATVVRCEERRIEIGIVNVGETPAFVSKVDFSSPDTPPSEIKEGWAVDRTDSDKASTFLVDPAGSAKIVTYQPFIGGNLSRFPKFPEDAQQCKYHITIETQEFDLKTSKQTLKCDCSRS